MVDLASRAENLENATIFGICLPRLRTIISRWNEIKLNNQMAIDY
jgi:hypothetical protein